MQVNKTKFLINQRGSSLLEATIVLPIILALFVVATDIAQLHLKQAVLGDATSQIMRELELPYPSDLSFIRCDRIISNEIVRQLSRYGMRLDSQDISTNAVLVAGRELSVEVEIRGRSILGRMLFMGEHADITLTQHAIIQTSAATLKCVANAGASSLPEVAPGDL